MKIVLASNNQGKIKEFEKLLENDEIIAYKDILGNFEILEDGHSFKQNAIKKATSIYDKLKQKGFKDILVISDDSGISVPALNNEPNIYSARYAGIGASDEQNNQKLISKLNEKNIKKTKAYYTACIAMVCDDEIYSVHGFMHGSVINEQKGNAGFGYDPLFIPNGYDKTLGQLDSNVKKEFSHRSKALKLAKLVLDIIV